MLIITVESPKELKAVHGGAGQVPHRCSSRIPEGIESLPPSAGVYIVYYIVESPKELKAFFDKEETLEIKYPVESPKELKVRPSMLFPLPSRPVESPKELKEHA